MGRGRDCRGSGGYDPSAGRDPNGTRGRDPGKGCDFRAGVGNVRHHLVRPAMALQAAALF